MIGFGIAVLIGVALLISGSADASIPKHEDASGNEHHLTEKGDPTNRASPEAKYGDGYDLDGTDDRLRNGDESFSPTGAMATPLAFEVDQLPASGDKSRLVAVHSTDGGAYVFLSVLDDGRVQYHNSGSGDITSTDSITTGFHTLTLRRTSSTVTVKVDGTTMIDGSYSMASWLPKSNNVFELGATGTNKELDGGIYEARYWDGTIPSQTTLDAIADPQDSSFDTEAQGGEDGLWVLEPAGSDKHEDRSGNGHHLSEMGNPTNRVSSGGEVRSRV